MPLKFKSTLVSPPLAHPQLPTSSLQSAGTNPEPATGRETDLPDGRAFCWVLYPTRQRRHRAFPKAQWPSFAPRMLRLRQIAVASLCGFGEAVVKERAGAGARVSVSVCICVCARASMSECACLRVRARVPARSGALPRGNRVPQERHSGSRYGRWHVRLAVPQAARQLTDAPRRSPGRAQTALRLRPLPPAAT